MIRVRYVLSAIALAACLSGGTADACTVGTLACPAGAVDAPILAIEQALLLPDLFEVLQKEGEAYGGDLDRQFLDGTGRADWAEEVTRIYDAERLGREFRAAFEAELAASGVEAAPILVFFTSDLGRRIAVLELSARQSLLDPAVEEGARAAYAEMAAKGSARLDLLRGYLDDLHLIDLNVASALNANVAFLQALSQSGELDRSMPLDEILAQVWAGEDEVRQEAEVWLMSFAVMAYAPLSDSELRSYIDFSRSDAGRGLNRALFAGFDTVFAAVSADLGRAVGRWLTGTSL
jgi:hypothetical protein